MKYIDMHCDTVTVCFDGGLNLRYCDLQISAEKLNRSDCAAQCFALFTQGDGAALRFGQYLGFYSAAAPENFRPVTDGRDLAACISGGSTGAILTVENLGFIGDDLQKLEHLASAGVKMASLVWNYENSLAYPNLVFKNGEPQFSVREPRGLKPAGRLAAEMLDNLKIILDISHLSDGGAEELLAGRKIPLVASHSNAAGVCGVCRNLTDGLIKKVADCGGVVGVNFCKDFLGEGDTLACVLAHVKHIINVGGEDAVAFGSDFDGIPAPPDMETCLKMPALVGYLSDGGISGSVLEKLCYKNFARVFAEVCG